MARHLKYVDVVVKPNGKVHFYFRRRGQRTPLPGAYNSPEFLETYWALRSQPSSQLDIGASRTIPGSVNAAAIAFYRSLAYTKNKPITQKTDRNILEAFRTKHGDKSIAGLERHHIEAILVEKAGKPSAQRNLLGVLRLLLGFAVSQKMRRDNPALGIELPTIATSGFHSWTEEELRQYESHYPLGNKEILALHLLLYTAGRRADVVAIGPPNLRGGRLIFTASKNGAELNIPVAEPLATTIAVTPMIGVKTFLVTEYGKPFSPAGFGNWFRERCNQAGLPHCSAHGLRKAFLRRMAEAGCSEDYIASISGHKDMREIRTYVQAANKARMADEGMSRTLAHFPKKEK
jgi:integrase